MRFSSRSWRLRGPGLSSNWGWLERLRLRLARLAAYGTEGYPLPVQRRLKILNVVAYLIAFFTFAYAVQHLFVDAQSCGRRSSSSMLAGCSIALIVPFLHRFNESPAG